MKLFVKPGCIACAEAICDECNVMNLTKQQIEDMRTSLRLGAQPFTKEAIDSLCAIALRGLSAAPEAALNWKERERLTALRKRAYHLKNRIDARPRLDLTYDKQELGALCWAIEKITGQPFTAEGGEPPPQGQ